MATLNLAADFLGTIDLGAFLTECDIPDLRTPRQKILYKHTCDLYRPAPMVKNANASAKDIEYTLAYAGVQCYFETTPENVEPTPTGRQKAVNLVTLDKFYFVAQQEVADTWAAILTTAGHPLQNLCWMMQGNARTKISQGNRRANQRMVMAKETLKPRGVP